MTHRRLTLSRITYIIWRIVSDFVGLLSRGLNAFVFGGSTAQSLSVRSHMEAPFSAAWDRRRKFINALFFWQEDHCKTEWESEVKRAKYILDRLQQLGSQNEK